MHLLIGYSLFLAALRSFVCLFFVFFTASFTHLSPSNMGAAFFYLVPSMCAAEGILQPVLIPGVSGPVLSQPVTHHWDPCCILLQRIKMQKGLTCLQFTAVSVWKLEQMTYLRLNHYQGKGWGLNVNYFSVFTCTLESSNAIWLDYCFLIQDAGGINSSFIF